MERQPFDWSTFTPIDTTNGGYSVAESAYSNLRFNVFSTSTYQIGGHDVGNLPGIAYKVYQDVSLWRVLLAYNGLQDPLQDTMAGIVLNIPDKAQVLAYLTAQATSVTPTTLII